MQRRPRGALLLHARFPSRAQLTAALRRCKPILNLAIGRRVPGNDPVELLVRLNPGIEAKCSGTAEGTVASGGIVLDPVCDRVVPMHGNGRAVRRVASWANP